MRKLRHRKFSDLLKALQLVGGRCSLQTQADWLASVCTEPPGLLCPLDLNLCIYSSWYRTRKNRVEFLIVTLWVVDSVSDVEILRVTNVDQVNRGITFKMSPWKKVTFCFFSDSFFLDILHLSLLFLVSPEVHTQESSIITGIRNQCSNCAQVPVGWIVWLAKGGVQHRFPSLAPASPGFYLQGMEHLRGAGWDSTQILSGASVSRLSDFPCVEAEVMCILKTSTRSLWHRPG